MHERIAVVTGGTGGLGRSVVETLVGDGWRVHVPWRSQAEADALRAALEAAGAGESAGSLRLDRADLADPASVEAFFQGVAEDGPGLELLCNLVGGFAMGDVADTPPERFARLVELNATTAYLASRSAIPLMRASGAGRIVNVAAAAALGAGTGGMTAYLASKAAVVGLTENLAAELASDGITVNAVAPTTIDTPANRDAMPDADRSGWLDPAEIAGVIRFLAGPDAAIVTGTVVRLRRG